MKEVWKSVKGFEDYLISNCGRVKTKSRRVRYVHAVTKKEHFRTTEEKFLKIYENHRTGYKFIQLYKNKKSKNKTIHRLVCENFIKNPIELGYVNHIDGNKHNNRVDNLEWCTNEYNHKHATEAGLKAKGSKIASSILNDACVYAIKRLILIGWNDKEIAEIFNVSRSNINLIRNQYTWKHIALTGKELELKEEAV